ncbi:MULTISPECIES: alpha/beta hydrolase [Bacillus]|uniref:Alpha/beta hydrolase n=1 Tax=Bacillus glycinifermentans TaxID=1664069 RepID=A0AAJ3YYK2_9BACI|nr:MULTISPECIES: alpha/beta hydrolase [Bacillus]KKB74989.1 carboxylesterase [Bacillus sp. TH008]MDU0071068.1 alpha/beta hydrolase [Bacillus sp. IG6]MED8018936.1 alpha/beta hydrolase [Bacillus glycinifermentans]QAT65687.1 alpha/beta hydrolase [Bacillus glycinifermentans]WKB75384.1 alpha/beta hydrolase [Bacillus glycinifermentans]
MNHIFERGQSDVTLLLLHGTGGNEHDLLPIGRMVDPDANLLGVRGNVLENGMPRFFKRLREGVFDLEDLFERTEELKAFLDQAAKELEFARDKVVAIGYSNGANIAGSLLFRHGQALKGAILHHPMVPFRNTALPDMTGVPIYIGAGKMDPLCPPDETKELESLFKKAGADVSLYWEDGGHQLTHREIEQAKSWYETHIKAKK